ncbi:hypothetical protein [Maribacter sp. 2210JD10-5]|uniref:hypothetical protein n=1 Tax=Maribacter sp. 2210JD10-5 TaxID=3386272 RepID=UPI0039BD3BD5
MAVPKDNRNRKTYGYQNKAFFWSLNPKTNVSRTNKEKETEKKTIIHGKKASVKKL